MTKEIRQEGRSHLNVERDVPDNLRATQGPRSGDYLAEAVEAGFSEEQAEAFLAMLFKIMGRFVELGFSSDACAYLAQSILDSSQDDSQSRYDSSLNEESGGKE